jgi:hypothetical protein
MATQMGRVGWMKIGCWLPTLSGDGGAVHHTHTWCISGSLWRRCLLRASYEWASAWRQPASWSIVHSFWLHLRCSSCVFSNFFAAQSAMRASKILIHTASTSIFILLTEHTQLAWKNCSRLEKPARIWPTGGKCEWCVIYPCSVWQRFLQMECSLRWKFEFASR